MPRPRASLKPAARTGARDGLIQAASSNSERIVQDVMRGMYEGRFVPGQRLVEPDIALRYDVSRPTVREAIKRLSALGVVVSQPNCSARIREFSPAEARDLLLVFEMLIGLAARLAAGNIDRPGHRKQLEKVIAPLVDETNQPYGYDAVRLRNRFYRTISRHSLSEEVLRSLSTLQVHLIRNWVEMSPTMRSRSYKKIGSAIFDGNEALAEARARSHIRKMIALLERKFPESVPK